MTEDDIKENARIASTFRDHSDPVVWRAKDGTICRQSVMEEMKKAQGGRCAICGERMVTPHVDHDHVGKYVRGLLCMPCNAGLGLFRDSPRLLASAIVYLEDKGVPYLGTNRDLLE